MMKKLPPIEKIYEAYSAIADNRITMREQEADISSSSRTKTYLVTWQEDTYTSSDSATYWQGYAGYPVLAVLMLLGKLPLNRETAEHFRDIDWTELNAKHKADYAAAVDEIFCTRISPSEAEAIRQEVRRVYAVLQKLDLTIKRGKALSSSAKTKEKEQANAGGH